MKRSRILKKSLQSAVRSGKGIDNLVGAYADRLMKKHLSNKRKKEKVLVMSKVRLISVTDGEDDGVCSEVNNPNNRENPKVAGLLNCRVKHQHWSVFEQAFMTLEIETTRGLTTKF